MTSDVRATTPSIGEFERQLERFIGGTLLRGNGSVTRDTRLFEDGVINSLRILDLIAFVEKTLGRKIPDRAVKLASFRSIAAIAEAFHPDARSEDGSGQGPGEHRFRRRTDRGRFASPIEALVARGDVTVSRAGQVALSALALDVLHAVDRTILGWAKSAGAAQHRYPSLIDLATLDRAGYLESFPQHLTHVSGPPHEGPGRENGRSAALSPAVCYHCYPEWEGQVLGTTPVLVTACGRCYRFEGGAFVPLERLWDFTMREIVFLGTREQVDASRRAFMEQATALVGELDLDASIEAATDPFFAGAAEQRRLMQKAAALKYELLLTVEGSGRATAAASFNHHHDFFGQRFDIRLPDGSPAHSGCVAFGLERWVLAILTQHGVDAAAWPAALRAWLAGAGEPRGGGA